LCTDRLKLKEAELRPVDDEPLPKTRRTMDALRRAIGRVVLIKVGALPLVDVMALSAASRRVTAAGSHEVCSRYIDERVPAETALGPGPALSPSFPTNETARGYQKLGACRSNVVPTYKTFLSRVGDFLAPLMPGVPERRTHDYRRAVTTNLYAALDVASGKVIADLTHGSVPRSSVASSTSSTRRCPHISMCTSSTTTP
jgi:hypothetical protein